jgi:hypothetical protein
VLGFRDATPMDVHAIMSDLSDISRAEVEFECGSWWAGVPKVLTMLKIPGSTTEVVMDESGTPLALFGNYPGTHAKSRTTLFVFTDRFIGRGLAAVQAGRRRLKALQFFYPGVRFHSYTTSRHQDRTRWFSLLGYRYVGITKDGMHHYVLPESDSDSKPAKRYSSGNPRAL